LDNIIVGTDSLTNADDFQWWHQFLFDPYLQKIKTAVFFKKLQFLDEILEIR